MNKWSTSNGGVMVGGLAGRVTATVLLVALAVVGCGDAKPGGAGEVGPVSPSGASGNPNPGGGSNPGGSNPGGSNPGEEEVAWVPPGPGRNHPPRPGDWDSSSYRWFLAFKKRDCNAIEALGQERHQQPLYNGLGDACRAALKDEDQFWPPAEAALQNVGNPTNCLDQAALRLLRDLVAAHQRAPTAKIRIVDHPPGSECNSVGQHTASSTSATPTRSSPGGRPPPPS